MDLSKGALTDEAKVRRVADYFSQDYAYSLKLEGYEGDPLEYFLFVSKKGNCEHFASATALLLRLMGIPSRVVGGFKGALWNPYGNYHIITNSMAHVWVEAYVGGRWIRIDTTPSYQSPAVKRISAFSMLKDAVVSFWYSNVVGFSMDKQVNLFRTLGKGIGWSMKKENLLTILRYALFILLIAIGLYSAIFLYKNHKKTPENLFIKLKKTLKQEDEPERILEKFKGKDLYPHVEYIVRLYQRYKYSNYRVYSDEVQKGYRALKDIKNRLSNSDRF